MKILAVDDEAMILRLLEQIVPVFGNHELFTAESGAEAIKLIEAQGDEPFDCFLFDIQMPGMDGVDLVRHVRSQDIYLATPIMMLTAMSDKQYIDRAFMAGATDYVTKPFEVVELETRLSILEKHAAVRLPKARQIKEVQNGTGQAGGENILEIALCEPISIYDVENVIDHAALENYLDQLSRSSLFGSTILAIGMRDIREFHDALSAFEFYSLVSDAAEVIADTLHGRQFLMSYAGNGIFVCIAEGGWYPEPENLRGAINLSFARTELYNNRGESLNPRIEVGDPIRLVWKSGNNLHSVLGEAYTNAEEAVRRFARSQETLWPEQAQA